MDKVEIPIFQTEISIRYFFMQLILSGGTVLCLLNLEINVLGLSVLAIILFMIFLTNGPRRIKIYKDYFVLTMNSFIPFFGGEWVFLYEELNCVKYSEVDWWVRILAKTINRNSNSNDEILKVVYSDFTTKELVVYASSADKWTEANMINAQIKKSKK